MAGRSARTYSDGVRQLPAVSLLPDTALRDGVDVLVRLVEAAGALIIFFGAVVAVVQFLRAVPRMNADAFVPVRLALGRYLALGLEFQLASDVLRTAISPSFEEIGKLAAIATIRTLLNFFLAREIAEERRVVDGPHPGRDEHETRGAP